MKYKYTGAHGKDLTARGHGKAVNPLCFGAAGYQCNVLIDAAARARFFDWCEHRGALSSQAQPAPTLSRLGFGLGCFRAVAFSYWTRFRG